MRLRRFIKSFINMLVIVPIINLLLLLLNKATLGEMVTKITAGTSRGQRFKYALMSFIQLIINITIIGFIVTIYFGATNKPSFAERFSGVTQR